MPKHTNVCFFRFLGFGNRVHADFAAADIVNRYTTASNKQKPHKHLLDDNGVGDDTLMVLVNAGAVSRRAALPVQAGVVA
jgi:hypothetical protein